MDEFLKSLLSTGFWLSVVLVSIVLNVGSGYIKSALDRFLSSLSLRWQKRSQASRERRVAFVSALKADQHTQLAWLSYSRQKQTDSVFFMLMMIFIFLFLEVGKLSIWIIPNIDKDSISLFRASRHYIRILTFIMLFVSMAYREESQRIMSCVWDANTKEQSE